MPEVTLKAYESQIDQMIEESRYIEGLAHVRHLLSQYPRYVGAYYLLGKAMLEADQPEFAVDLFRRALNANPEHLVSRIGLGLAHQKLDELDAAIWNLERAFELEPGNAAIAEELRHIYGARDGIIPDSVALSRAGLARMYIRAQRYDRAASELQKLVDDNPNRPDLLTALAEAYWRAGQIVQASEIGQRILDHFPYNIKANLLMASLWGGEGAEESKLYLRRASDVDPEGVQASNYMSTDSPMPTKEVMLDRLVYDPGFSDVDTESRWYHQLEAMSVGVGISEAPPDMSDTEVRLVDITAGLESQIEIPDWLRDMGSSAGAEDESAAADMGWMLDFNEQETLMAAQMEDTLGVRAIDTPEVGQADVELWTESIDINVPEVAEVDEQNWETLLTADQADDSPDWLSEMKSDGEIETLDELPDFTEIVEQADTDLVEDALYSGAGVVEMPQALVEGDYFDDDEDDSSGLDWLYGGAKEDEPATEEVVDDGGALDWLQGVEVTEEEESVSDEDFSPDGGPDWLQDITATPEADEKVAKAGPVADEVETAVAETAEDAGAIDWLTSLPSAEDESEVHIPAASDTLFAVEGSLEPTDTVEAVTTDDAGALDWLSGFGTIDDDAGSAEDEDAALEGAPEWLRQLRPAAIEEPEKTDEPDDLFGISGEEILVEEDVTDAQSLQEAEEEDVPDWMQEYTKKHGQTGMLEMPDWMDEYSPAQSPAPPEPEPDAIEPNVAAVVDVDMFGWQSFGEQIVEVQPSASPVAEETSEVEIVEEPAVEESLDWLKDAGETSDATVLEAPELVTGIPAESEAEEDNADWLEGFGETLSTEAEETFQAAEDTATAEAVEQFPDWLQEFDSGTTSPFMKPEEVSEPPAGDAIDWLKDFGGTAESSDEPVAEEMISDSDQALAELFGETDGGDSMSSGDAALGWLEDLAAGKEDELRTQSNVDQQAAEEPGDVAVESEIEPEAVETVDVEALESGDMMSGADALSWLASLSAGKEDELRVQAEAEQQDRLAELLGRPRSTKPEVVAETAEAQVVEEVQPEPEEVLAEVEETTPVETFDAEALESGDMMSGADALSWLASLSAGKEDELRVQAEAEQQDRLAELLGRPRITEPDTVAEATEAEVIEEVQPEPEVILAEAEETAPVETIDTEELESGDMMSGTDALSWLASLSAGKEDELRAQAEAEQQDRLAELLGRPRTKEPEVMEEPVEPELEPIEVLDDISQKPVSEDITEETIPENEAAQLESLLGAPIESFVDEMAEEAVVEVEEDVFTDLTETAEADVESEAESVQGFAEDMLPERGEAFELADVVEEIVEEPSIVEIATFDDQDEDTLVEEVIEVEPDAPVEQVAPEPIVAEQPVLEESLVPVVEEATAPVDELEEMRLYLKRKRSDHPARLNFARALWETREYGESLNQYARLIKSGALMDEVLADLNKYEVQGKEAVLVLRSLGDAYMKLGNLDEALGYFNRAQNIL